MPAPLRMMWRYTPVEAHWRASPATAPGEELDPAHPRGIADCGAERPELGIGGARTADDGTN